MHNDETLLSGVFREVGEEVGLNLVNDRKIEHIENIVDELNELWSIFLVKTKFTKHNLFNNKQTKKGAYKREHIYPSYPERRKVACFIVMPKEDAKMFLSKVRNRLYDPKEHKYLIAALGIPVWAVKRMIKSNVAVNYYESRQ